MLYMLHLLHLLYKLHMLHMRYFLVRTKILRTKNTLSQARLVVFHWFHKGLSHFGTLFRPVLAKYVGLRNETGAF